MTVGDMKATEMKSVLTSTKPARTHQNTAVCVCVCGVCVCGWVCVCVGVWVGVRAADFQDIK